MRKRIRVVGGLLLLVAVATGVAVAVHTSGMGIEATVDTVRESSADAVTAANVKLALSFAKAVDASQVDVDCSGGVVTLRGQVASEQVRATAGEIAAGTIGVTDVRNELRYEGRLGAAGLDDEVEALRLQLAAVEALRRDAELGSVQVSADGSTVVLEGLVQGAEAKRRAERLVAAAPGARRVDNRIVVVAPVPPPLPDEPGEAGAGLKILPTSLEDLSARAPHCSDARPAPGAQALSSPAVR